MWLLFNLLRERDSNPRRSFEPCQLMRLVRYQLLYPTIYSVAHSRVKLLSREWKSLVLVDRRMCHFSGDVRSRTGVYKNVNDTLLSGCIGFEVLGTSTNYHKGGRLHIRRPIDTGQNYRLNRRPLSGSKRLGSKCVTVWRGSNEAAWNCTNLVSQLLEKILSVYCFDSFTE